MIVHIPRESLGFPQVGMVLWVRIGYTDGDPDVVCGFHV